MKSYTDIEQSKKLSEILPLESADMYYDGFGRLPQGYAYTLISPNSFEYDKPCWSLAALLDVLPKIVNNKTLFIETSAALWHIGYRNIYTARADNPVNACVTMIIHLHELKML